MLHVRVSGQTEFTMTGPLWRPVDAACCSSDLCFSTDEQFTSPLKFGQYLCKHVHCRQPRGALIKRLFHLWPSSDSTPRSLQPGQGLSDVKLGVHRGTEHGFIHEGWGWGVSVSPRLKTSLTPHSDGRYVPVCSEPNWDWRQWRMEDGGALRTYNINQLSLQFAFVWPRTRSYACFYNQNQKRFIYSWRNLITVL